MPDYDTGAPYRGVESAVGAITEKIEKEKEEKKQRARQFDALLNYADASGVLPKEEGKVMSLEQLSGYMKGVVLKSARAEEEQKAKVTAEQLKQYQRQNAQAAQVDPLRLRQMLAQTEQQEAMPGFAADLADYREGYPTATDSQVLAYAAQHNPKAVTPGMLDDFMKAGGRGGAPSFVEDPVTGARYAQQGNSLLPSGINPAKQTNEAFDITDGDGNVVSRGVRGPKGTIQLIRTPPPTQVAKDAEATNKSWMDRLQKANAEVESLREAALGVPSTDEERDVAAYKKLRAATLKLQEIQAQEPKFAPPKAATGAGDRVKVVNKAGQVGWIPKAQLNDALKKGYSLDERRN